MPRLWDRMAVAVALCLTACTFSPAPAHPRPPVRMEVIATTPALPTPALTHLEILDESRWRGRLQAGDEVVEFDLWRGEARDPPRPFVLLVPILAGGDLLMELVASSLFGRGYDVALCRRAGSALRVGDRGPELQALFARTLLHQQLLLAWHRAATAGSPRPHFVFGISLGGMVATALAAHDPTLTGVAICLAGGDVASLVPVSSEPRVRRWIRWRKRNDGVSLDHLRWELRESLELEPLRVAGAVQTERVLFVSARLDDVVPRRNQDLLWEALGRPKRMDLMLGHYSAALALYPIVSAVDEHFDAMLSGVGAAEL